MRRMRGFSLVELMVALALGLMISAAAVQLFLANQVTLNFQRGMNDVLANGRFVVDQMMQDVRMAGLGPAVVGTATPTVISPIIFSAADLSALPTGSPRTADNQGTPGLTANDGAGVLAASDQLVLRHLALTDTVDCEGNSVLAGKYVISRYFVRADTESNDIPALACDAATFDGTTLTGYNANSVVLVDGVNSFQVLYGLDDGPSTPPKAPKAQVTRYVSASTYAALSPKPVILSVRIGLYLQSQERAGDAKPPESDIQVLDEVIASSSIPADGLLRRLFISTVGLRNASASGV